MGNINGRQYEYADIKVDILGASLTALRGITYKSSQEKEVAYGQGNDGISIQSGNKKKDGQLMVLKSDYDLLDAAAQAAGYEDIVAVPSKYITITIVYQQGTNPPSTDSLIHVAFTDAEDGMKQGDKMKEVTLPFIFLRKRKII